MNRSTKMILIIAAVLVAVGIIGGAAVLARNNWELPKFGAGEYRTSEFEIRESFRSIAIESGTEDIVFLPAEGETARVVFSADERVTVSAAVKGDTLEIGAKDEREWYERFGLSFGKSKITVYLPGGEYAALSISGSTGGVTVPKDFGFESIDAAVSTGSVDLRASASGRIRIKTDTGSIRVEGVSASMLDCSVTTGAVEIRSVECAGDIGVRVSTGSAVLKDVSCSGFVSSGSTGPITLENVIASGMLSIERSTGGVKLDRCDAAELDIKTDTGDVTGTLLSEKVFIVKSDTGRISVPETTSGGRCRIETDTGDIRISLP